MTETQNDILEIKEMLKSMQKNIQTMMNAIEHDEKYRPIEEYDYYSAYPPLEWSEDTSVSKRNF